MEEEISTVEKESISFEDLTYENLKVINDNVCLLHSKMKTITDLFMQSLIQKEVKTLALSKTRKVILVLFGLAVFFLCILYVPWFYKEVSNEKIINEFIGYGFMWQNPDPNSSNTNYFIDYGRIGLETFTLIVVSSIAFFFDKEIAELYGRIKH